MISHGYIYNDFDSSFANLSVSEISEVMMVHFDLGGPSVYFH